MVDIHLRQSAPTTSTPRTKPAPNHASMSVPFHYSPSDDGTDENLLILLHGLGDTHNPFAKLGRQLKLPQTAVLALRAPEQVPFLYEESYQWYRSFDDLGEIIERPNPTPALDLLTKVVNYLTNECGWPLDRIHLFGFAQGGSVAAEFGISLWKQQLQLQREQTKNTNEDAIKPLSLGSIVTISGSLLSYPTLSLLSSTPILVNHNASAAEIGAFKKGYATVIEVKKMQKEPGMPASRESWEPIMRFWSTHLGRRQVDGLYEVMSGSTPAP